jgi:hypothetical protein
LQTINRRPYGILRESAYARRIGCQSWRSFRIALRRRLVRSHSSTRTMRARNIRRPCLESASFARVQHRLIRNLNRHPACVLIHWREAPRLRLIPKHLHSGTLSFCASTNEITGATKRIFHSWTWNAVLRIHSNPVGPASLRAVQDGACSNLRKCRRPRGLNSRARGAVPIFRN